VFGLSKKSVGSTSYGEIETVIGRDTVVKGNMEGNGSLRIDGTVEGDISVTGSVIIGEEGLVKGNVSANEMIISGRVEGNVTTTSCLSIYSTGSLIGDVQVSSLHIEEGGSFKGHSEMRPSSDVAPAL